MNLCGPGEAREQEHLDFLRVMVALLWQDVKTKEQEKRRQIMPSMQ